MERYTHFCMQRLLIKYVQLVQCKSTSVGIIRDQVCEGLSMFKYNVKESFARCVHGIC